MRGLLPACWLLLVVTAVARAEHRHALVIGNSQYPKAELASPPRDIRAVGEALKKRGFVVTQHENVTDKELKPAFEAFARTVPIRGTALVYFSGYAAPAGKPDAPNADNVLRPIDGTGSANGILPLMNLLAANGGSALNVMIVDGCYAYPSGGAAKALGLNKPAKLPNESLIVFAAPFGEVIEPVKDGLSPLARRFTAALDSTQPLNDILAHLSPTQLSTTDGLAKLAAPASRAIAPANTCLPGSKAGEEWTSAIGTVFCWCPPGSFVMGSPPTEPNRQEDESQVPVTISRGFWMSKYEFTRTENKALTKNPGVYLSTGDHKLHPLNHLHPNTPDIILAKLNEIAPNGWQYTLATEAEWEYACRAGTRTAYSFGSDAADLAKHGNFSDRSLREGSAVSEIGKSYTQKPFRGDKQQGLFTYAHKTWNDGFVTMARVGSYPPNAWGLHDMHGNMAELTSTPYDAERAVLAAPAKDGGLGWVIKGGGWLSTADYCRSAFRGQSAHTKENYMSLRLVLRQKVKP